MMNQLRLMIRRLIETGAVTDKVEEDRLHVLLSTKRFNPYCLRHSSITNDSDYLPDFTLKKKVRWSMNSKQGSRYIKSRMGNDLKKKILAYNGIISADEAKPTPTVAAKIIIESLRARCFCEQHHITVIFQEPRN
jgi:integrase/recombinase XerD